jgi:hypothetical protein
MASPTLAALRARGFDQARELRNKRTDERRWRVSCSQCEALVICGVATHEAGCPNATHECAGCNAVIPARQKYCEVCI